MGIVKTLKDALTLSLLQEVFTNSVVRSLFPDVLMDRGDAMDIDGDLAPGTYNTHTVTQGTFPSGSFRYGKIMVLKKRNSTRFQIAIAENGDMASRTYYEGKWNAWRKFSYTTS